MSKGKHPAGSAGTNHLQLEVALRAAPHLVAAVSVLDKVALEIRAAVVHGMLL